MATLTSRGRTANAAAKLPALEASRAQDPHVRKSIEALREWVEVRLGARGDRFERAVTFRDLDDALADLQTQITTGQSGTTAAASTTTTSISTADISALSAAVASVRTTLAQLEATTQAQVNTLTALVNTLTALVNTKGDFSSDTSTSVAGEVVLFDDTTGKIGTRATGTGFAKLTSGVLSADSANTVRATLGEKVQALTDGTTISVDASLGNNCRVTLGGNRTLANPTNLIDGQVLNFRIKQDGTGSRTLAYGSKYKFPGGTAPVLSTAAGALDFMSCEYDVTDDTLVCVMSKAFA